MTESIMNSGGLTCKSHGILSYFNDSLGGGGVYFLIGSRGLTSSN